MGWFLTRSKTGMKKRKPRRRGGSARPRPWNPQRTLIALEIFGLLVLIAGLASAWQVGEKWLADYAEQRRPFDVWVDHVRLHDAPPWMTAPVRQQIAERVAGVIKPDAMQGESLEHAAAALAEDPWVANVKQIRRLGDGRIIIEADYREPVAVVETAIGYILVDIAGVRLPGVYLREQVGQLHLPMIAGVDAAPPDQPGRQWTGEDLRAALALVELLSAEPYADQVRTFDVRKTDLGMLRLAMLTDEGEVMWGYPPGHEQTIEPSWRVKVERLRRLYASYHTISAGRAVVEIYGAAVQAYGEASSAAQTPEVRADYTSLQ